MAKRHRASHTPGRQGETAVSRQTEAAEATPPARPTTARAAPRRHSPPATGVAPPRRLARTLRRTLIGLALIGIAAALLPSIVTRTGLSAWLVHRATAHLPGAVRIGTVRLGWFTPVELSAIEVTDPSQQPWLQVRRVSLDRTLLQLLRNRQDLGRLQIDQPIVRCAIRPGGSSVEDWLAKLMAAENTRRATPHLEILVADGQCQLAGGPSSPTITLAAIRGQVILPPSSPAALEVSANIGRIEAGDMSGDSGHCELTARITTSADQGPRGWQIDLETDCRTMPIGLVQLAAERFEQQLQVQGAVDGHIKLVARPQATQPLEQLEASLRFAGLRFSQPAWANEQLSLASLDMQLAVAGSQRQCQITRCDLQADIGQVQVRGEFTNDLVRDPWRFGPTQLFRQPFQFSGQVNLAQLAAQLPRTIRLRDGVELTSGQVTWDIQCDPSQPAASDQPHGITGRLETAGLQARYNGRTLALQSPLQVQFQAHATQNAYVVDTLTATSSFLQLTGTGEPTQGRIQIQTDLSRLQQELGQFFDFREATFSGQVDAGLEWQVTALPDCHLTGYLRGDALRVACGRSSEWEEPKIALSFSLTGQFEQSQLASITQAKLDIDALEHDLLRVELTAPVVQPSVLSQWPVRAQLDGDLARWRRRVQWVLPVELPMLSGQVTARAALTGSGRQLAFEPVELRLRDFSLSAPGLEKLQEPALQLVASGRYSLANRSVHCDYLTVAGTAISLRADRIDWSVGNEPPAVGQMSYRGDLAKLWQRWQPAATNWPSGQIQGRLKLAGKPAELTFRSTHLLDNFRWQVQNSRTAGGMTAVWQEPKVQIVADGMWQGDTQQLQLAACQFNASTVALELTGTVTDLAKNMNAQLSGRTRFDWQQVSQQLRPWIGSEIQIEGRVDETFQLSGPLRVLPLDSPTTTHLAARQPDREAPALVPTALTASATYGWQSARGWGFETGAAKLHARLAEQTLAVEPFELEVSGGRVRLTPRLSLRPPLTLSLDQGPLAEQVAISPEMCQRWLKYVAPLVAEATSAQGRFSLRLARAQFPLLSPEQLGAEGSLAIDSAHVGPGPLAREFLLLAEQVRALVDPPGQAPGLRATDTRWIDLPEQRVSFRVDQGRVAHQDLTMVVGDITIRTRGWVGFDQQIGLVAMVPLRDEWIGHQPWLAGLRGQTIEIPVHGTLQQPQVDRRALAKVAQQTLRGAAAGYLQQELQRQINRALPTR